MQGIGFARRALAVVFCVGASACGGTSTDERLDADTLEVEGHELTTGCESEATPPEPEGADAGPGDDGSTAATCSHAPLDGYGYAVAPSFWLGEQARGLVAVQGPGYLVAVEPSGELAYARASDVFVSPDGTLEDASRRALLGYPPDGGDAACLTRLRAPATVSPTPTSYVSVQMNLDAHSSFVTFDLDDPNGTSNMSISFMPFDSRGEAHYLDIYFQHADARTWRYHALVDGSDLDGGMPGEYVEVGTGSLVFTADGALASASAPDICVSFADGAAPHQCLSLDFGHAIADGGQGLYGTTSFASFSAVMAMAFDGTAPGTAVGIGVAQDGLVSAYFDNGTVSAVGVLALARFPRERELAASADGSLSATPSSGPAQLGLPGTPGRGLLLQGSQ